MAGSLFLLLIFVSINSISEHCISAAPTTVSEEVEPILSALKEYNNYDLHFDQRQSGKGNFKIKLNGFVFLLPTLSEDSAVFPIGVVDLSDLLVSILKRDADTPLRSAADSNNFRKTKS